MSKGKALYETGNKLIKWLPDYVTPNLRRVKEFGSKTKQINSLLDFMSTISDDAGQIANDVSNLPVNNLVSDSARRAAFSDINNIPDKRLAFLLASKIGEKTKYAQNHAIRAWDRGLLAEVSDNISSPRYRILTNPLATGLEADIQAQVAPKNFMGILRDLTERNLIVNPQDVRSARKLAGLSDYERGQAMEFFNAIVENANDGYRYPGSAYKSLEELIESARLIG